MPSVRLLEPSRSTFAFSVIGLAPAATPTDIFTMKGAAGKIIQLRRVVISGLATAAGQMVASLVKRTVANTGGTATTPVATQADALNNGASASVLQQYSVNPATLGAGTILRQRRIFLQLAASGAPDRIAWDFGDIARGTQSLRLNGANEWFAINMNGGAVPAGGVLDLEIEWTEQ